MQKIIKFFIMYLLAIFYTGYTNRKLGITQKEEGKNSQDEVIEHKKLLKEKQPDELKNIEIKINEIINFEENRKKSIESKSVALFSSTALAVTLMSIFILNPSTNLPNNYDLLKVFNNIFNFKFSFFWIMFLFFY